MDTIENNNNHIIVGACSLGSACMAKSEELKDEYKCRYCNRQLHGFISGCSHAKNPKDFRDGVICKIQPCFASAAAEASAASKSGTTTSSDGRSIKPDGVAIAAAAGLPKFLWETQQPKRKRDPNAPKLRRQRYTKEHKQEVLAVLLSQPVPKLQEVAQQFNIPEGTLRGWYDDDRKSKQAALIDAQWKAMGDTILDDPHPIDATTANIAKTEAATPRGEVATAEEGGEGQPPKKKRRQRYSNETKIQVILALETRKNSSLNDVAKEFNVAAGTVRGWREEADKIQKQAMENRRVGAKANPSRDPLKRVWDAILNLFERNSRLPVAERLEVNVAVVRTTGKQARDILLQEHQRRPFLTPSEFANMEKFKASETWARKWARDHQVISTKEEALSSILRVEAASHKLITIQRVVVDYPPERVYTMTSLGLYYKILPHRTYVNKVDERRVRACKGLKCKDRITLYVSTNETGTDKIPITCIGKYENPACFLVGAQKKLPYLHQKQTLSDAGTFQMWWRTVFLPHVRSRYHDGEKVLLLVESLGPCKAELLKDPTGQVRVEALPPSTSSTLTYANNSGNPNEKKSAQQPTLPQCQALEYGILETIKRRYRYRMLLEVTNAFDERSQRRKVARDANFPVSSYGLREGSLANIADAMRLLDSIWKEVATTTIAKSWQRTKLRPAVKDITSSVPGQRAKSEKRQTTREKKQVVKVLNNFLKKHESKDFAKDDDANQLEEMVEKLKNCFLYTDGEVIEAKEMIESLEEWVGLEDSQGMIALSMEEIKEEMNIDYLVGLNNPVEGVAPEADEPDDPELEPETVAANEKATRELKVETAMELATKIKATACTLFGHGDILGELAVRLDEASDSIFGLLRKQNEAAEAKIEAEQAKAAAKVKAAAKKKLKEEEAANVASETSLVTEPAKANGAVGNTDALHQAAINGVTGHAPDVGDVPVGEGVDISDLAEFGDAQMGLADV